MSDTPRNKVNILSVCAANTTEAFTKIEAAKKSGKVAKDQVSAIKSRHQAELDAANQGLSQTASLIQANEREGVPTEKLEKKSADIKARITKLQADHANSDELKAALEAIDKANADLEAAQELHEKCKVREALANSLKEAYDVIPLVGAIEAPEYETLDEAVDEYIAEIPMLVSISEELEIEKVGIWQVPNASQPAQGEIFAKEGVPYRYNRLPKQLEWLGRFAGTEYAAMPKSGDTKFSFGNVAFVIGKPKSDKTEEGESDSHAWMGTMLEHFQRDTKSIFSPDGITYQSNAGIYPGSGLCYIKSEGKFFSLWQTTFPSVQMIPGKVKKPDRWGIIQTEDGMVPKGVNVDMSKLFEPFFPHVAKKVDAAREEFEELSTAKSPLAVRLREAIEKVGVTESTFEGRGKRLPEAEIFKEVGAYWEAFVNSPWEAAIVGDIAMIKHLCERGIERPHVWSNHLKGHYGLRVRTRDHDWIVAQIYCSPNNLEPKVPISPDDVVYLPNGFIKVGPCLIAIVGRVK